MTPVRPAYLATPTVGPPAAGQPPADDLTAIVISDGALCARARKKIPLITIR